MFACQYLFSNHFHGVFTAYFYKNNMTHISLDETLPFWKARSEMQTAFLCRLSYKMLIAQNLLTIAYLTAKTDPESETRVLVHENSKTLTKSKNFSTSRNHLPAKHLRLGVTIVIAYVYMGTQ